jgi:hypothetical protein
MKTAKEIKAEFKSENKHVYSVKKRVSKKNNWTGYEVTYADVLARNETGLITTVSTEKKVTVSA